MTDILLRHDDGPVATLTLNAPDRLNALSDAMLAALAAALAALATDRIIRVVILRGAGRAFCAGHDLREMQAARAAPDGGTAAFAALFAQCSTVMQALVALPQIVIAQVHGIATAAGCQLACSCDLVVADTNARFGVNGVNIGLFCSTPMVALTRKVPRAIAFEMLVTGEFLTAARATEVGLVNRVSDDPRAAAIDLAQLVASKLGAPLRMGKAAFYAQAELGLSDAYALTGAVMTQNMALADTNEGITAFLEKRKPGWAAGAGSA
jgi:enoyl-CoA hydratase/carnithine racemase